MTNLLERLKSETRSQHGQMEAVFALPETREDHRRWTAAFLGFLEPLEENISRRLGSSHRFTAGRHKSDWLHGDLLALGMTEGEIAALPRCGDLPATESIPDILGALYVFEGATLGGQMISRHLEARLGFSDGHGYRYFRSYGPEVGRRWQEFRQALADNSSPATDDATVASAAATFAKLHAWCTTHS